MHLFNPASLYPRSVALIRDARRRITQTSSRLILGISLLLWIVHLVMGEIGAVYYLSFAMLAATSLASLLLLFMEREETAYAILVGGLFLLAVVSVYYPMSAQTVSVYFATAGVLWLFVALLSTLFLREWISHLLISLLWIHDAVALPLLHPRELWGPLPYMILISFAASLVLFYLQHFLLEVIEGLMESKQQAEVSRQALAGALTEKEILLKEVHHRVKNNLQIISSLLNLHAASSGDRESAAVLTASQGRVRSMALVHEELYQSENLSSISLKEYVIDLIRIIEVSYRPAGLDLATEFQIEDIEIDPDTALPLGLVLNELLTNIYKHAFAGLNSSRLRLEITRVENEISILLRDWGRGLPEDFILEEADSMGTLLITSLTEQLGGRIAIIPASVGTEARITLPYSPSPRTAGTDLERLS